VLYSLTVSGTITQAINTAVSGNFSQTGGTYVVSNSGNLTFNIGGMFSVSAGEFILINNSASTGATVNVTGNVTLSATAKLNLENTSATNGVAVFNALADFTSTGTNVASSGADGVIDFGAGTITNNAINISGNFNKSGVGTFGTTATGQPLGFVFNKSGTQTFSYSGASSDYVNYTVSSASTLQMLTGLTISAQSSPTSSFTVNGTLDAATFIINGGATNGSFILSSGATLKTANTNGVVSTTVGSISNTINTRTFNSAANYIFSGAANQTANFGNVTINNLTISNTVGSVTLNAATTIAGNVQINNGGGSLTGGAFTHLLSGNWTNNGTYVPGTSTINFNGTTQSILGSTTTFNNVILTGGTKTFGIATTITGNLSIPSGAIANFGSLAHTAGTLTLGGLGTAASSKFGSTSTTATAPVYKNNIYFTAGTTGYVTTGATSSCTAPTITFGSIPSICQGALSASIPYTATTGNPDLYSLSGTGITTVTNGALSTAPSSITIALSSGATPPSVTSSAFTVSSSLTGCVSNNISGSVTVTPTVGTPTFSVGPTTVCQDAADTTYTATATNSTGITYSVLPVAAGTINSGSGSMNWSTTFSGTATITASAAGCGGPKTVDRVVTVTPSVTTPVYSAGATTVCQDADDETYTASASNATGISYSVLPSGAGTINSGNGIMNWNAAFSGTATITASAAGCGGPKTADRVVTVNGTIGTPAFTAGATSVCQGTVSTTYTATASNTTAITYSVLPSGAGTINSTSGVMSWNSVFFGSATITATATGCGGPKTFDRVVTVSQPVTTPVFNGGPTALCQDAVDTTYSATATNFTAITYAVSPGSAGTIGSSNGIMNWSSTFSGNATITASAAGCSGPKTVNLIVVITPSVATPGFTTGAATVCQDAANETYTATAANNTGITYSILPAGAGTIDVSTGVVDWSASFSGTATITASATGCNGPKSANRSVTVTATVGNPSFSSGATTVCQDASSSFYVATASNNDGITYTVSPAHGEVAATVYV
jgi:hypothetical protein